MSLSFRGSLLVCVLLLVGLNSNAQNINYFTTRLAAPAAIHTGRKVGTIEGALSVSPSGAATYSVPIKVAPGTAGMEPKLALVYSSQGGSSILGQGWNLSGLSAITRGGKDYYHDGKVEPITLSNDDAFYMDGSRLTVTSGTHGKDNAQYTTEQEVGTRVQQHWDLPYNAGWPTWFSSWSKDGMRMNYGVSGNSRVLTNNNSYNTEILSWKLSEIVDVSGNRVDYLYDWISGEHLLTGIKYTVNANAGLSSYNEVKFIYKTRTDQNTSYVAGSGYASKHLLEKIEVWNNENGNVKVRYYEMFYIFDGAQSLLQEMREAGLNGEVVNETQFMYGDDGARDGATKTNYGGISNPIRSDRLIGRSNITGDFNGDGFTDIIEIKKVKKYTPYTAITPYYALEGLEIKFNKKNNNFVSAYTYPLNTGAPNGINLGSESQSEYFVASDPGAKLARNENFHTGDFDGDGVEDLLICMRGGLGNNTLDSVVIITKIYSVMTPGGAPVIKTYIPQNNVNYINDDWNDADEIKKFLYVGDFDGDGRSDFLTMIEDKNLNTNSISGWQITTPGIIGSASFNPVSVDMSIFPYLGNNVDLPTPLHNVRKSSFNSVLNFDGGMNHEFMYTKGTHSHIFSFSKDVNGNWSAARIFHSGYPTEWHAITLGDFNGDGMTDILTKSRNTQEAWSIGYSSGKGFIEQAISIYPQPWYCRSQNNFKAGYDDVPILTADIDKDGKSDICYIHHNIAYNHYVYVKYNKGNGSFKDVTLSANASNFATRYWGETVTLGDFDGDGQVDIFNHSKNDMFALSISPFLQNNSLREIRNGLGVTKRILYSSLIDPIYNDHYTYSGPSSYPLNTLKIPFWTVSIIESGIQGRPYTYATRYKYKDLKMLKDGRGVVGFAELFSHNLYTGEAGKQILQNIISPHYVPQTVSSELGYVSNNQFNPVSVTSDYRTITSLGGKRYKVLTTQSTSTNWLSSVTSSVSTAYDANDNPTTITTSIPNVETNIKTFTYAPAGNTKTPMPSEPDFIQDTHTRNGAPSISSSTTYNYYNGNLTNKIEFAALSNSRNTTYSYNLLGVLTGKSVATFSGTRSESYDYDPNYRFVRTVTNSIGQSSSITYDPKWGVPLSKTAFDGTTTNYQYDAFGRIAITTPPEGYSITRNLSWSGSVLQDQNSILYYENIQDPSTYNFSKGYNVFAQEVETSDPIGLANGQTKVSVTNTAYDITGRKIYATTPHLPGESYLQNVVTYDFLGRTATTSNVNGTYTYDYSYAGGNLKTEITDPSNRKKYTITDPTGKTIESGDLTGVLNFEYDSWGNPVKTKANYQSLSTIVFDDYNRRRSLTETSSGTTTYDYNDFGEVITQTDAAQNVTTTSYDGLGRPSLTTFPEGTIAYEYYNLAGQGEGAKLKSQTKTAISGTVEQKREYNYDGLGRVSNATYTQYPNIYKNTSYTYDAYSRLQNTLYSTGISVDNTYLKGALNQVLVDGSLVYQVNGINGMGQPTDVWRGSGLTTVNNFHWGNLTQRYTTGIQDYKLDYDWVKGLITRRREDTKNVLEDFEYDAADRLTKSKTYISGVAGIITISQEQTYGQNAFTSGNILSKSDVGPLRYNKHAVSYTANAAGALPQTQQDVSYLSYHRPLKITEGSKEANFVYGTDYERTVYELKDNGALQYRKYYLPDGVEIIEDAIGTTTEVTYVPGADGVAAIVARNATPGFKGPVHIYYPYTDHLGSVNTLLENGANGLVVAHEQAFDPWGRRRDIYNWQADDNAIPPADLSWLRGFTGHEHLDGFKLINMNARLYDPLLGRLLSVDNLVGNPSSAMGYNRYTYANNNPISYIDPDGNNPFLIAVAVGALISATSHTVQTFYSGQTVSFGGVLQSAALGGVMGGFSFGIGTVFSSTGAIGSSISNTAVRETAKALAHGLLGSGFSAMQGGNAWSGFMSGAFSSGVSSLGAPVLAGLSSEGQYVGGLVLSAGTGAASSALTGGDPWMGAAIGAIAYATNQAMHRKVARSIAQAKMMAGLAAHFEFGNGSPYYINAEELDFSQTSMRELKIDNMKIGERRQVNLFKAGINANSLSFGVVTMTYRGADYFSIDHNTFDFDYQRNASNARNVGTFIGGSIFGRFFNTIPSYTSFPLIRPNYFLGGPFEVYFDGYAHIKR